MSNRGVSRVTKPPPSPAVPSDMGLGEVAQSSDFICLSAFSEVEGPCIVQILPSDQRGFNAKSYALKIMSVDLHSQNTTDLFIEDSQSVLEEGALRCYVHHSFFLDLRARGYARPLSFSYITKEKTKIMSHFDEFLAEFSHVSNLLKFGNHQFFLAELEAQLDEIEESFKDVDLQKDHDSNTEFYDASEASDFSGDDQTSSPSRNNDSPASSDQECVQQGITEESTLPHDIDKVDPEGIAKAPTLEHEESKDVVDDDEKEAQVIQNVPVERNASGLLKTSNSLVRLQRKKPRSYSMPITEGNQKDPAEAVPLAVGPKAAVALLRNLIEKAKRFYKNNPKNAYNKALSDVVKALSTSKDLKKELYSKLLKKRANTKSELRDFEEICGHESFRFAMNRIDAILAHFSRNMAVLNIERNDLDLSIPLSTMLSVGNIPLVNFNGDHHSSPKNFLEFPSISKDNHSSLVEYESFSDQTDGDGEAEANFVDATGSLSAYPVLLPDKRNSTMKSSVEANQRYDPLFPLCVPSGCDFGIITLESYASGLWQETATFPGQGLLQFRQKYAFLPRLVYSLLIGRVLVIHSSPVNKLQLEKLLRALSLFIPGCWRQKLVVPWQNTPLRITDLFSAKLIGLSKAAMPSIPDSIKKYITTLNFDDDILYAPTYESTFVEGLLSPKKAFFEESAFLAYINAELFYLASRASLFYRMCCVGITRLDSASGPVDSKRAPTYSLYGNDEVLRKFCDPSNATFDKRGTQFDLSLLTGLPTSLREESKVNFGQMVSNIDRSDLPIIEYLADVVKEQQAMEMGELNCNCPVLRLIELPSLEFNNKRKK